VSRIYGARQRAYQDRFDTRRIADKIEELAIHAEISDMDKAFIESRDMFWLSSVDEQGSPTVSYKGGDPGFVKVLDEKTLAFPLYDGNGMFYSAGNVAGNGKVGLLFMDFERPNRLRVQGTATVSETDPLIKSFHEAILVVRVTVSALFPNCPRYVHRMEKVKASRYVPRPQCPTPMAGWKRIDLLQADLPKQDQERAKKEGAKVMSIEEWFGKVAEGSEEA
jgi:predicted pyridoxine 5'-phosphate oxidase superfamily flavin-nucleotide-binding protein